MKGYHHPGRVADQIRWARKWYRHDRAQPLCMDDVLQRAAETLERSVSEHWREIALLEAAIIAGCLLFILHEALGPLS